MEDDEKTAPRGSEFPPLPNAPYQTPPLSRQVNFPKRELEEPNGLASVDPKLVESAVENAKQIIQCKGRGKSFTSDQDEAICNAYLCITQDPNVDSSSKKGRFWDRVSAKYKEITNDNQRSPASIKARWATIQKACIKYSGILREVQGQRQGGMTEQNEIDLAKRNYKKEVGKPFPNLDVCWEILKHNIKFGVTAEVERHLSPKLSSEIPSTVHVECTPTSHLSPKLSEIPSTIHIECTPTSHLSPKLFEIPSTIHIECTPTSTSEGSVHSPRKMSPVCNVPKQKKAKVMANEDEDCVFLTFMENFNQTQTSNETKSDEMEARRLAALEKNAEIEAIKAEMQQKEMEEKIMQMDLNAIQDPQLKVYYKLRKSEILAKLTKSAGFSGCFADIPNF